MKASRYSIRIGTSKLPKREYMSATSPSPGSEPRREDIDLLAGATMLEFGTSWCGYCRAAQPHISSAMAGHSGVRHIKVEDGPGLKLGRSFTVKLWPTLVFLRDGKEVERLVRPADAATISRALTQIERSPNG